MFAHCLSELNICVCRHGERCRHVSINEGKYINISVNSCKYIHPNETRENYFKRVEIYNNFPLHKSSSVPVVTPLPSRPHIIEHRPFETNPIKTWGVSHPPPVQSPPQAQVSPLPPPPVQNPPQAQVSPLPPPPVQNPPQAQVSPPLQLPSVQTPLQAKASPLPPVQTSPLQVNVKTLTSLVKALTLKTPDKDEPKEQKIFNIHFHFHLPSQKLAISPLSPFKPPPELSTEEKSKPAEKILCHRAVPRPQRNFKQTIPSFAPIPRL
jgi:hypothetical protein